MQYPRIPTRHDRRNARRRPALGVLHQHAGLRRQDLGDVGGGQVAAPAVVADRPVLQQPQLGTVPSPFNIAGHVVKDPQYSLEKPPQCFGGQAMGRLECIAVPRRAKTGNDRPLGAHLAIGQRLQMAFDPFQLD
ncbi:hypothetical protein D3C80_1583820 [compost metagenome]